MITSLEQRVRTQRRMDSPANLSPSDSSRPEKDEHRPLIVRSEDLLQGRRELWIEHGDEMYRLRLTRAGKLYLTK